MDKKENKATKSKYSGKKPQNADAVKQKIKKKAGEKKKKKDDRRAKLQEKKRIRVQQKNEKKLVSEMVEVIRVIFPSFVKNEYLRKYFNLNQFLKLEMFSEFQGVKVEYKGDNSVFMPVIQSLLKKVFMILNPRTSKEDFITKKYETHMEKLNELMLLYVKG